MKIEIDQIKFKGINKGITLLIIILINIGIVNAQVVPHGIDGTIYELDGVTEVRKGIDFYVHNLNNGHFISGKTGYGSSGGYSVAINGNDGDTIEVKAWNKYNEVTATLPLSGVMYNVNLWLNMTYPPIPPNITSEPIKTAIEDQFYFYDVEAFDENEEDILEYNLAEAPTGMSINQSTGLIKWMPLQKDVGNQKVIVQVSDRSFLVDQSFRIKVENVNDRPEIKSTPITGATEDVNYFYDVDALDEDGDLLFYYLIEKPDGMVINETTGLINWTPQNDDVGLHNVLVQVSDGELIDEDEFTINVVNVNNLPAITSLPITNAVQNELYNYDVEAYDIDDDLLFYNLTEKPNGMIIDENTGLISWTPGNDDVRIHNVIVKVSDDEGFTLQPYALIVENINDAPVITSTPITVAIRNKLYVYDVNAYDADGDTLTYSLLIKPNKMTINRNTGLIEWNPKRRDLGPNNVIVEVSDGNLADQQEFTIRVYTKGEYNKISSGSSDSISTNKDIITKTLKYGRYELVINTFLGASGISIKELNDRPSDSNKISKRVYKYLEIENVEEVEEATLNFSVDLKWLSDNGVNFNDIVLSGYADDSWIDLETKYLNNDGKAAYYTVETTGFSYFAITVREGVTVKNMLKPQVSGIEVPFRISGVIYKFGRINQVESGTRFSITNLNTTEVVDLQTGIGPYTGAYYVLLYGNEGDTIKVEIEGIEKEFFTTLKNIENLDFMLNFKGNGFSSITGLSVLYNFVSGNWIVAIIMVGTIISGVLFTKFKYKKDD